MLSDEVQAAILARRDLKPKRRGGRIQFCCPRHEDRTPSAWTAGGAWGCFACGFEEPINTLASELGIDMKGDSGLTLEAYADDKGFSTEQLRSWGITEAEVKGRKVLRIPYYGEDGQELRARFRSQTGKWWEGRNQPIHLYGIDRLADAKPGDPVTVCEGESDCHALWSAGFLAVGVPGATTWRPAWKKFLKGLEVYVWEEPDQGGTQLTSSVTKDLPRARIIHADGAKDPAELRSQNGNDFAARFRAMMAGARPIDGPDTPTAFDVLLGPRLDRLLAEKQKPIDAVPTPFPEWSKVCGDEGGRQGFARGWHVICAARTGAGKALDVNTPVPTPDGWKKMGNMEVGDTVFDEEGAPCSVVAATETMFDRLCYRIEFSDGSHIVADACHQWLVYRGHPKGRATGWAIVTTEDICRTQWMPYGGGRANYSVPVAESLVLPEVDVAIDPYVLGAWLGDGSSVSATIHVGKQDVELIDHINACGEPTTDRCTPGVYGLSAGRGPRGDTFQERLRGMGLLQNKHIPPTYLRGSAEQRLSLIQGLMDTDGHCSDRRGRCEFTTITESLRDGMTELLLSVGLQPHVTTGRAMLDGRDCGPKYRINFTAYDDTPVFRLTRKRERQPERPSGDLSVQTTHRFIEAVYEVEGRPVRCIQVDSPSGLFLAGPQMIPTHNSILALQLAAQAMREGERVCLVSLEMHQRQVETRLLAIVSGVPIHELEMGKDFSTEAYGEAAATIKELHEKTGGMFWTNRELIRNVEGVTRAIRYNAEVHGCRYFIIDYLQLAGNANDPESITAVSHRVRQMAAEFNVVSIGLSQFNRSVSASSERPIPQGLMGGSALENDAEQVVLIDHSRVEPYKDPRGREGWDSYLLIAKNRHGPPVDIPFRFNKRTLRMRELLPDE